MSEVEETMLTLGMRPEVSCHSLFVRSLRKNMEREIRTLNQDATFYERLDLFFFALVISCAGILASGIKAVLIPEALDLTQILGVILFIGKGFDKNNNLSLLVQKKRVCAGKLSNLAREITLLELEIYTGKEGAELSTHDMLTRVNKIWAKFNDVGMRSLASPSSGAKKNYGSFSPFRQASAQRSLADEEA